ncbi:hypothetical protein RND71_022081 [Anisodus tanguticus]|uniref:Uncharacterized protein n=1 Tax=Anisodus tanguticus TaxID=243964 RepID=A0AAE1RZC9_9SOLA|nr:hypothetical protein RND71_022081 [Anisodus tanguticus]
MVTDNIKLAPSTALLEDQKVVAQPQHAPKPRRRSQKFKQIQYSSMSAKPFHPGNKMSFGLTDQQGLLGSSRPGLQANPKLLEDSDRETSMSHPGLSVLRSPEDQIAKNKEVGAVVIKRKCFVPPMVPEHSLRNIRIGKQKQLQDSCAPTFAQMKLAYHQGLLGSSRVCLQENPKLLMDSDKETSMSHPGPSVLQSPDHQIAKNKETGVVVIKHECFVLPMIPEQSLRKGKQKQLQDSFAPTFSQMKVAYQQGLVGSSGVRLQENPNLLEDSDRETSMSRPGLSVLSAVDQIPNNKEAGAVVIKRVPPMIPEHSLRNEKQKQLQDSFAPTFAQMKLAYQQGLLGSSRVRLQENSKVLEDSDKDTSKSRLGRSVLQSPEHQIAKNKEAGAAVIKCECLVPPMIPEHSLSKGKQKLLQDSFPPTSQMKLAYQPPNASEMNLPLPESVSQMNLLWLLEQQMQLLRTYEKHPEVVPDVRSIYKRGTCVQRLNQYIYRQQQRPSDNNIEFWSNLAAEFFAPNAKKRLCLSSNKRRQQIGCIFPQEAWCCEICKVRPAAGFEISAEVLPRLCKIKFESGMLEELLYMDIPEECYTPSGHIVLNYAKVTEESVYEAARVFLNLSKMIDEKTSFLRLHCDRFVSGNSAVLFTRFASSIRGMARVMDKSLIDDLGYTKRYVRCLQTSEIVNSMKDLMDYGKKYGIGPAEAMARIHRQSTASRVIPMHNSGAEEGPRQPIDQEQPYNDNALSQDSTVITTDHEGTSSLNCSPRATSPTSSTASSKRPVHQADLVTEPKRKKTNSGENSGLLAPIEPVLNQPISTTPPYSSIGSLLVQPSSKNLADALIDTKVLDQNEKTNDDKIIQIQNSSIETNGKYYYGFETDGTVDKSYYMDQFENLNGVSLFPSIHIGSPLTGTLTVNDTNSNNQQFNDHLPNWKGEIDPIDDIQFY